MAAKKARKPKKYPESVVGVLKGDKVQIDDAKLAKFLKGVKKKYAKPTVKFVARNAPFMRGPIVPV